MKLLQHLHEHDRFELGCLLCEAEVAFEQSGIDVRQMERLFELLDEQRITFTKE